MSDKSAEANNEQLTTDNGQLTKMFCPKCGQQQVSEGMRFCPRCGLPLEGVARLLDADGYLAEDGEGKGRVLTKRQIGTRKGLLIMAGGLGLGGVGALLTAMKDDLFVLLPLATLVFVVGLMRMLYGMLIEDDAPRARDKEKSATKQAAPALKDKRAAELPPARDYTAADFTRTRTKTAEIAQPPSVTESTTRLLEDE